MDEEALAAAEQALQHWPIEAKEIVYLTRTENFVFRVRDRDDRQFVLRLHRPGYHSLDELLCEQRWTNALLDFGVDVPVAVPTRSGAGYASAQLNGERRYAGVLEWVDGEELRTLMENDTQDSRALPGFAQLGTTMAQLHNQAAGWDPGDGFARHAFDADGLVGEQPFWGRFWESKDMSPTQRAWLAQARRRLYPILQSFDKSPATYSLIHADLHPGNLVIDGPRVHVIDFDDAGFGWHQYDLAIALFHYRDEPTYPAYHDALLNAYRLVRPISDRALKLLPLFLVLRALALIGWLSDRPEHDKRSEALEMYAYANRNLDAAIAHGEI